MINLRFTLQTCGSAKLPQSSLACHIQAAMIMIMGLFGQDTLKSLAVSVFFQGMEAERVKCSSSSYCLTKITKVRNKLLYIYIYIYIL
jgi:hypothetical protein